MTIIVEDGTGLANSNSYISVADADAYFLLRLNAQWATFANDVKEASLIKATDYIAIRWGAILRGKKATDAQALDFPRIYSGSDLVMPIVLPKACAEYAFRESVSPLMPDPTGYDEAGRLAIKSVDEVGPIREERSYASYGSAALALVVRPYPLADGLMKSLVGSGNQLIRA